MSDRLTYSDRLYDALLEKHKALQELLAVQDETISKLKKITTTDTCCAYCGAAYCQGTPRFGSDALAEHIKVCPEHPMREAEQEILKLTQDVEHYKEWARHRERLYVEIRQYLRQVGIIKPHEEITVLGALKREISEGVHV